MGRSLTGRGAARALAAVTIGVPVAGAVPEAAPAAPLAPLVPLPAIAGASCAGSDIEADALPAARRRAAIRCLLNRRRAAAGVPPVRPHPRLLRAAGGHTADMVRRRFFGHVSPDGRRVGHRLRAAGVRFSKAGEVLGWACGRTTPRAAVEAWFDSPPHRDVVLDGAYGLIGVGTATAAPARCHRGATWTVVLVRPR